MGSQWSFCSRIANLAKGFAQERLAAEKNSFAAFTLKPKARSLNLGRELGES